MLTNDTINAVAGTAKVYADRGVHLTAAEPSVLAELVKVSLRVRNAVDALGDNVESAPSFTDMLQRSSNEPDQVNNNDHDTFMANAVDAIGTALDLNNRLARDVVNPMTKRVCDALSAAVENARNASVNPLVITPVYDNDFWYNPYFVELFSRYKDTVPESVRWSAPAIAYDQNLLHTGVASLDAAIDQWIASCNASNGCQSVEYYWNSSFGSGSFDTKDILNGDRDSISAGITLFLAASKLYDSPVADSGMSLVAWQTMCNMVKAQAGRYVAFALNRIERDRSVKRLVLQYPAAAVGKAEIFVDGNVYNQFLEDGGSPEAIFGAFYRREFDYSTILNNAESFVKAFKAAQAVNASQSDSAILEALIIAVRNAVSLEINTLPEDAEVPASKEQMHARLLEHLGCIRKQNVDNLWATARDAVCYAIYPHTDVRNTLVAVDEQMTANSNLTPREAALYANIDLLAKWLAKLIQTEAVRI